jgi:Phosphoenolpyruvate phosphomutase
MTRQLDVVVVLSFLWCWSSMTYLSALTIHPYHSSHVPKQQHQQSCYRISRSLLAHQTGADAKSDDNDKVIGTSLMKACPAPARLRALLEQVDKSNDEILLLPCCYDGLTARLIARTGFYATFMTGFGVSAVNGYPDTQLVSYNEMVSAANTVSEALANIALERNQPPIPCIAVRCSYF